MNATKEDFKFRWLEAVTASGLPDKTVRIAVTVWHYADSGGTNARPGYQAIADGANVSVATVKRHLAALREAGWIKKTSPWTRTSNDVYALVMPEPDPVMKGQLMTHDEAIKGQHVTLDSDAFIGQDSHFMGQNSGSSELRV